MIEKSISAKTRLSLYIGLMFACVVLSSANVNAGARNPSVDPLFYSLSNTESQQLEDTLDAYIGLGARGEVGAKYRLACRLGGRYQPLEFSNVIGGNFVKNELSKDDVWKAIRGDSSALAQVMKTLKKARKTPNVDLPDGVDQMIAYAVQDDRHVKFWGISPGDDHFLAAESKGQSLSEIAVPICAIASKLGLNHE